MTEDCECLKEGRTKGYLCGKRCDQAKIIMSNLYDALHKDLHPPKQGKDT